MIFQKWADREIESKSLPSRRALWDEFEGVSDVTLEKIYAGGKLKNYDKAKAVSDHTGGVVTVKELCEG